MIDVKKMAAQGDVIFRLVDAVPEGYEPTKADGELIVTHSETGHHHVAKIPTGIEAVIFSSPKDTLVSYMKLPAKAPPIEIEHRRPWDTHETLRLLTREVGETIYEIRRQREYAPEGWRRVED